MPQPVAPAARPPALPRELNRKIGLALHDYAMIEAGDRLLIAVSGGIDSLALAAVLSWWRRKAPITFELAAITIDHGYWRRTGTENPAFAIEGQLRPWGLALRQETAWGEPGAAQSCFHCARDRRSQLFTIARDNGHTAICFGHHRDDLIDTFFLNLLYGGNVSTMRPKQILFDGRLKLLRPLAYLSKAEVCTIGRLWALRPQPNLCPHADDSRRQTAREIVAAIERFQPDARLAVFSAMKNVRADYLP
ncbi:MAG: tRNA 2-thiocytidine biosynthesis protein TtcA [Desulfobulbaceae bacterium]|jgi:tRNA 2-thiocytidine biosynthesis protein TtcA|nr:tRNA 2-thiocytidine biosynthesis protein TtcA [Desulfobulbaceae bacterium]